MQPFSKNPKLEDWNPSKEEIAEILEARKIWISLGKDPNYEIPEEQINILNVAAYFNPTFNGQEIVDEAIKMVTQTYNYHQQHLARKN